MRLPLQLLRGRRSGVLHVHLFRWAGDDPVGQAGLYACRCGEVRRGL